MTDIPATFRLSEPADFSIDADETPGAVVVSVRGELDVLTVPLLWERLEPLIPAAGERLVVDLSETRFIDSMGIGVLVRAQKRLAGSGRTLVLRAPAPQVRHVLGLTGLDRVFEIQD